MEKAVGFFHEKARKNMFLSLFLILSLGVLGGFLMDRIRMPKLIWYLILGILLGPSVFNIIDSSLIGISSYLRQIALIIILTRSALSLDVKGLLKIGRPAILLSFLPASFEILGICIFAPLFLDISIFEALLLGSVLAAVSPAVVVPRMIKIKEEGYGKEHSVTDLVMAGSSLDDIYVIVLFYAFKGLVASSSFSYLDLLKIPESILLGIAAGLLLGFLLGWFVKKIHVNATVSILLLLFFSFGLFYLEEVLKPYVSLSSLLGVMVLVMVFISFNKEKKAEIKKGYESLWSCFEILLFTLVGVICNTKLAFSKEGGIIVGVIFLALAFRCVGVFLSILFTKFTFKERLFIILSYLPKATVQASIGAIALQEGLSCGSIVLASAILAILVTAPLGAILIDFTYKHLLSLEKGDVIKEQPKGENKAS